jgi:hypothetical protein
MQEEAHKRAEEEMAALEAEAQLQAKLQKEEQVGRYPCRPSRYAASLQLMAGRSSTSVELVL